MSKGLEALKWLVDSELIKYENCWQEAPIILESINDIEKELKALEIVKNKFKPYCVANCDNGKVRIWLGHDRFIDVSQDEFDLLKEVLINE